MADVFLLTFLRLARLRQVGGILPLENLHPGLFVVSGDQTPFGVETEGVDIQVTDVPGFRVKIGVMTIEPIHAPMGFEVGVIQNTPEGGAAHRPGGGLGAAGGEEVIYTPS